MPDSRMLALKKQASTQQVEMKLERLRLASKMLVLTKLAYSTLVQKHSQVCSMMEQAEKRLASTRQVHLMQAC